MVISQSFFFLCTLCQMTSEVASIHDEMNQKVAEIQQLRINLHKRDNKEAVEEVEDLKRVIGVLQKENNNLKVNTLHN